MATYYVQKTRRNQSKDGTHNHIIGVLTEGVFYSNAEVGDSIARGDRWLTHAPGWPSATIKPLSYCPRYACMLTPFLTTEADSTAQNNLENLPED